MNLDKITTVGELHKAIAESNLSWAQMRAVLASKGTRGLFGAIDLLRTYVTANERKPKP